MAIAPVDGGWLPMSRPIGVEQPIVTKAPQLEGLGQVSFQDMLLQAVGDANQLSQVANTAATNLAEGRSDDIHGTMIAMQEAGIQTKLVGSIKNKVVDAFYEMWRMSI